MQNSGGLTFALHTQNNLPFAPRALLEWLEDFLRNQNIPMVIVSHDREFLDQICTQIVDTEGGIATEYY